MNVNWLKGEADCRNVRTVRGLFMKRIRFIPVKLLNIQNRGRKSFMRSARMIQHHKLGGVLWVHTRRHTNHCGLQVRKHVTDSLCMREDGVQRGKGGEGTKYMSVRASSACARQSDVSISWVKGRSPADEMSRSAD